MFKPGQIGFARALLSGWLVMSVLVSGELAANPLWHDHVHEVEREAHSDTADHFCAAQLLSNGLVEPVDPIVAPVQPVAGTTNRDSLCVACPTSVGDVLLPPSCGPPHFL